MFWDVLERFETFRDALGHPRTLWDALTRSGKPWDCGTLWDGLGSPRTLREALGRPGMLWDILGRPGTPWDALGAF